MNTLAFIMALKIVTIDSPEAPCLHAPCREFAKNEWDEARQIAEDLHASLKPYLPAAGLAAPQIGVSRSIFIYSPNRKDFEAAINPTFVPVSESVIEGWEGCFSVLLSNGIWKLAKVPRYETIAVTYFTEQGEKVEKILDGFGAKVFQHEYDHLRGIECIDREDALVQSFDSKEELDAFMREVKKEDATRYRKPHA